LFRKHYDWSCSVRSIGVRTDRLILCHAEQIAFFNEPISVNIDKRIKALTEKFGKLEMEKSAFEREKIDVAR